MTRWKWVKYVLAFLAPVGVLLGMLWGSWFTILPVVFTFFLVPAFELIVKPDPVNVEEGEALMMSKDPVYDLLLYLQLPLLYLTLILFLNGVHDGKDSYLELFGKTLSMGILCGIIGINVGHELGHRHGKTDLIFARLFLLSSLYMHFNIEHNRGHHKWVGTHQDPASARYGENIYHFWVRSISGSYLSAWKIEKERLKTMASNQFTWKNEMIRIHIFEFLFLGLIFFLFGLKSVFMFCIAALIGILLLEAVNYIEHYGLGRRIREDGSVGRTLHCHSWNSDHLLSRILLFELSRHSDHHYKASKKYQVLNHVDESPQMPAGYAGMIILALIPSLWFRVMNPLLNRELNRFPELILAH